MFLEVSLLSHRILKLVYSGLDLARDQLDQVMTFITPGKSISKKRKRKEKKRKREASVKT